MAKFYEFSVPSARGYLVLIVPPSYSLKIVQQIMAESDPAWTQKPRIRLYPGAVPVGRATAVGFLSWIRKDQYKQTRATPK
jgi:hypothetical protein